MYTKKKSPKIAYIQTLIPSMNQLKIKLKIWKKIYKIIKTYLKVFSAQYFLNQTVVQYISSLSLDGYRAHRKNRSARVVPVHLIIFSSVFIYFFGLWFGFVSLFLFLARPSGEFCFASSRRPVSPNGEDPQSRVWIIIFSKSILGAANRRHCLFRCVDSVLFVLVICFVLIDVFFMLKLYEYGNFFPRLL